MIVRIVRMKFRSVEVANFVNLFEDRKSQIRSFPGCQHLELWQDTNDVDSFFTFSMWESEQHLNRYRFSEFFKDTWGRTKLLFAEKPMAWSAEKRVVV